jgi:hypothetical protein
VFRPEILGIMIPIVAIVTFWVYMIVQSVFRSRIRELEIRERIAMIEKGMLPSPEADPRGFDRAMGRYDSGSDPRRVGHYRHRRAGVTLVAVGLGLMLMIGIAGQAPESAIGVGGFIVLLGIAFIVNSILDRPRLDEAAAGRSDSSGSSMSGPSATDSSPRV